MVNRHQSQPLANIPEVAEPHYIFQLEEIHNPMRLFIHTPQPFIYTFLGQSQLFGRYCFIKITNFSHDSCHIILLVMLYMTANYLFLIKIYNFSIVGFRNLEFSPVGCSIAAKRSRLSLYSVVHYISLSFKFLLLFRIVLKYMNSITSLRFITVHFIIGNL